MEGLFDRIIKTEVECSGKKIELPILYFKEDSFALFFTASLEKLRKLMPTPNLKPIPLTRKKGVVAIACFNYTNTTISPYGEVAVAIPVVHKGHNLGPLALLREANHPGFGMYVIQLPVTTPIAKAAGLEIWGYPKFLANMTFLITPELLKCTLTEADQLILSVEVERKGILKKDNRPIITYSTKDGRLIKTTIKQKGIYMLDPLPEGRLVLGNHPVAKQLKELEISPKPFISRIFLYRPAVLPKGEVVEEGVQNTQYYEEKQKDAQLMVKYTRL